MTARMGKVRRSLTSADAVKAGVAVMVFALTAHGLAGAAAPHVRQAVVSDWAHRHVVYPNSKNSSLMARIEKDPRWTQNWYLRHPSTWWPEFHSQLGKPKKSSKRDWSVSLGTATFEPLLDFTFDIPPQTGYGSLNTTDEGGGTFLATAGTVTVTGGSDIGSYPLYPGGPAVTVSPSGAFDFDNLVTPSVDPPLDVDGLLFSGPGLEINIWGNGPDNYSFYDHTAGGYGAQLSESGTFTFNADPGGGLTYPAKYSFDVNAAPSCTNDFVVIGIPANPASGGQANIVGFNNLYSSQGPSAPTPFCGTSGPSVMFAYASGTGEVPASVTLSQNGAQIAYVENLTTGSSYFHVLTMGTTGNNGSSATAAVVPGSSGGNNAVDQTVLLSPDGGITNQSSTTAPFVVYTGNDANDVAYVTTYSNAGIGSGYLYKITNVFSTSGAPTIAWSVPVNAVPSSPVYDPISNQVFFTDASGRVDYVVDTGSSPSVVYSAILASGATSANAVTIDIVDQMVYACFNSDGTNAIVVQSPASMASTISIPVGTASTTYAGPSAVAFNNAFYAGSGTPLMYVAGTGTGILPSLYAVGFDSGGLLNALRITSGLLVTGAADSSAVTEFYNDSLQTDYLFVGVTGNCIATLLGGTDGCVMSLDITNGFPLINFGVAALPAGGGTSGIIVDNDSSLAEASSIYYATKTGGTLVKATQSGLN